MDRKIFFLGLVLVLFAQVVQAEILSVDTSPLNLTLNESPYVLSMNLSINTSNTTKIIWISVFSPYFSTSAYPNLIISSNETIIYPLNITFKFPSYYPSGFYPNQLIFNIHNKEVIVKDININITTNHKIEVRPKSKKFEVSMGDENCTTFLFLNKGNVDEIINFSSSVFYFKPSILFLYRGVKENVSVCWKIPNKFMEEETSITFFNSTLNLSVSDKQPPKINKIITPDKIDVNKEFVVLVNITDNILVDETKYNFQGEERGLIYDSSSGLFKTYLTSNTTGEVWINITAKDSNKNMVSKNKSLYVNCYNPEFTTIDSRRKVRTGSEVIFKILNTTQHLKIKNFTFNIEVGNNISMCDTFLLLDGSKDDIKNNFNISRSLDLGISCNNFTTYRIMISIKMPEFVCESEKELVFQGEFAEYDVCPYFNGRLFGQRLEVEPKDTGIYSESFCRVVTYLPIDTNLSDISFGLSREIFKTVEESYGGIIEKQEAEISGLHLIVFILITIIILIIVSVVFMLYIYPRLMVV